LLLLLFPHLEEQVSPLFSIKLSYLTPPCALLGFFHLENKNQNLLITDCTGAIDRERERKRKRKRPRTRYKDTPQ
jgi:hypothetical protein